MSWRDKVQAMREGVNCQNTPAPSLPKTTETLFVVSVSTPPTPFSKNQGAANDAAVAPATPDSKVIARVDASPPDPDQDPDRWCGPHSTTMNTAEIDTFTARLARFTDKGLSLDDGETLADKPVTRDRESDDRRLCLECLHLAGHGAGSWRCGAWQAAGVAIRARDAQLPTDFVNLLKRCDGFTGSH